MSDLFDVPVETLSGQTRTLASLRGSVLLIVNVASHCGHTPQYAALERLQKSYGDRGFSVLGFPSNQFLQEPGSARSIEEYCTTTWGVTFPMFAKIRVNGRRRHPIYEQLVTVPDETGTAGGVQWNFEKFLVLPDGTIHRFRPAVPPDDARIVALIEANLPR